MLSTLFIFLLSAAVLCVMVFSLAKAEEKNFKLQCHVSELEAESGQQLRMIDSLKNTASYQDALIKSYASGWKRTNGPDFSTTGPLYLSQSRLQKTSLVPSPATPIPRNAIPDQPTRLVAAV